MPLLLVSVASVITDSYSDRYDFTRTNQTKRLTSDWKPALMVVVVVGD